MNSDNSVFVEAINGLYYKNPILFGKQNNIKWFLKIDSDVVDPLIVIKKRERMTIRSGAELLTKICIVENIIGKIKTESGEEELNCFPPELNGFEPSYQYYFSLKNPIPIPEHHEGVVNGLSRGVNYVGWSHPFSSKDIWNVWNDPNNINPFLIEFVLRSSVNPKTIKKRIAELKASLRHQFPNIKEENFLMDSPLVVRVRQKKY